MNPAYITKIEEQSWIYVEKLPSETCMYCSLVECSPISVIPRTHLYLPDTFSIIKGNALTLLSGLKSSHYNSNKNK